MSQSMVIVQLSLFVVIAVGALAALSAVATSASLMAYGVPDLYGKFGFGGMPAAAAQVSPASVTVVDGTISPFSSLAGQPGIGVPAAGWSLFRSPYMSHRSITQTVLTPQGPAARSIDTVFDGPTGQRVTTMSGW